MWRQSHILNEKIFEYFSFIIIYRQLPKRNWKHEVGNWHKFLIKEFRVIHEEKRN